MKSVAEVESVVAHTMLTFEGSHDLAKETLRARHDFRGYRSFPGRFDVRVEIHVGETHLGCPLGIEKRVVVERPGYAGIGDGKAHADATGARSMPRDGDE